MSQTSSPYQNAADNLTTAALQGLTTTSYDVGGLDNAVNLADTAAQNANIARTQNASSQWASKVQSNLSTSVGTYATLNESHNANVIISKLLDKESKFVESQNRLVKQQQYLLRDKLMMYEYLDGYYRVSTTTVIVSLYVTLVLLIVAALFKIGRMNVILFWAIMIVLGILYILYIIAFTKNLARIHRGEWQRIDWRTMSKPDGEGGSC